ncbi:CGNR zinc finger domain-containing protein [Agrobacterium tumefaciens]|uniref:CGNR zinc finger domain-containing protein n=1 Tax=Agrobacterium tumefaciens TaxID=358 RepID=UPI00287ED0A8|nr:CGNR zinc finger domain-containing protein [Agrobacterium tumefaciens]MDS7596688.1 CGNR zinc finger domain-containing protein [Agrobacterium tumefaciens]
MSFRWTPHRFAGGALALDVANSVILRFDASKSVDRFAVPEQIESFADAVSAFCAERDRFSALLAPDASSRQVLLDLREAIDGYFRAAVFEGRSDDQKLADLLFACGATLRTFPHAASLANATAHSALSLIASPDRERLRICGNCGWLFIDRSKNRSRIWCDMAVCGNRQKAARHYRRKKEAAS